MIKLTYLRPEDYWIFPLSIASIVALVFTIYASPLSYRVPALLVGAGLLWFTAIKVNEGYTKSLAWIHVAICSLIAVLLFVALFSLTN